MFFIFKGNSILKIIVYIVVFKDKKAHESIVQCRYPRATLRQRLQLEAEQFGQLPKLAMLIKAIPTLRNGYQSLAISSVGSIMSA